MLNIFGFKVISSPLCERKVTVPNKVHNKKKGSLSYHNRIQKKWIKHYGTKIEIHEQAYFFGDTIAIPPKNMAMIENIRA